MGQEFDSMLLTYAVNLLLVMEKMWFPNLFQFNMNSVYFYGFLILGCQEESIPVQKLDYPVKIIVEW